MEARRQEEMQAMLSIAQQGRQDLIEMDTRRRSELAEVLQLADRHLARSMQVQERVRLEGHEVHDKLLEATSSLIQLTIENRASPAAASQLPEIQELREMLAIASMAGHINSVQVLGHRDELLSAERHEFLAALQHHRELNQRPREDWCSDYKDFFASHVPTRHCTCAR